MWSLKKEVLAKESKISPLAQFLCLANPPVDERPEVIYQTLRVKQINLLTKIIYTGQLCLSIVIVFSQKHFQEKALSLTATILLLLAILFTKLSMYDSQIEMLTIALAVINFHALAAYNPEDDYSRSTVLMTTFCSTVAVTTAQRDLTTIIKRKVNFCFLASIFTIEYALEPDWREITIQALILLVFGLQNDFGKSVGVEHINQLEEIKLLSKQNELYMAGIVHDLRNPVSCLQTFFDLLKQQKDKHQWEMDVELQQLINSCCFSTENIVMMVSNILDYSKMRNGNLRLNYTHTDPFEIIQKVVDLLASGAKYNNNKVHMQVFEDQENRLPQVLLLDQNKLSQIIVNLLSETVKRSQEGTTHKVCLSWFPNGQKSIVNPGLIPRYEIKNGNQFRPFKVDEVQDLP